MLITKYLVIAATAAALPFAAQGSTLTTLYRFKGGNDGGYPPLIYLGGDLYGTAPGNGSTNLGNVFKVNAATGHYHVVHDFQGGADGTAPENGVINQNGVLYGTTTLGGSQECTVNSRITGCGTIFSINIATNVETVLYTFPPSVQNSFPLPGGITYLAGTLYGTTSAGGVNGVGSVFGFTPATGSFSTLYSFEGGSSVDPTPQLIHENGLFYGTTMYGGKGCLRFNGCGIIFSINPNTGTESVVHTFASWAGGRILHSNLIYHSGALMGDTELGGSKVCKRGCGASYKIKAATGHESIVEDFESGAERYSGITVVGGNAYETLPDGGSGGYGQLIEVNLKSRQKTVLYTFTGGTDGSAPQAALTYHKGAFYGSTNGGNGTIFKFVP